MTRSVSPEGMSPEDKHFKSSEKRIPSLCFLLCSLCFENAQRQSGGDESGGQTFQIIREADSIFVLFALCFILYALKEREKFYVSFENYCVAQF
jgi:hypothetical protein